ncbi:DUF1783-domain-containing protein [Epithele typhae]|uniref:DUF1783-domain-containing protein n=1 Tax=Epithele typhae TaxID=378194 RepID=UPI002007A2D5|nr:DUF1783-domain-containing protein [Epithele typhae]KAH9945787.1 DUF1783-domain-containing protein [Epithele typhae]
MSVPLRAALRAPCARAAPLQGALHSARYASTSQHASHKPLPDAETFDKTARPGLYYSRPSPRDLPPLRSKWPAIFAAGALAVTSWGLFMLFVTNQEKLSSSVMQQLMAALRESPELRSVLGEALRPEPVWWMNGDPWINGAIHMPGGAIDLSFRVKGHKQAGTLYFTSIRKAKGENFQIVIRFKVIADDGTEVLVRPALP